MKKHLPLAGLFAALLILTYFFAPQAPSPAPPSATPSAISSARPARIVSVVPSVTEMLFAVGAGGQLVGVTTWCTWPEAARDIEKVGDLTINVEKVLSLHPDLVVSSRSLAGSTTLALERAGLRVETVDAESFEGIAMELERLGRLTGNPDQGEAAAQTLMKRVEAVARSVKGKRVPTVYIETSADPVCSAGPDSYAGDVLRRAGGSNIMTDLPRPWSPISWEVVLQRDPEIILIAHDHPEVLSKRPGWSNLRAVKEGRVFPLPIELFVRPSPRLVEGLELAARILHEEN